MKKIYICILSILFLICSLTNIKAEDEIILFYSDSCPHCHEVLDFLDENELEIILYEENDEGFEKIYREHLDICNIQEDQAGYPTIYHNEECSFGKTNNIELLSNILDIKGEKIETNENEDEEKINIVEFKKEPLPIHIIISMFIGPALFIYITYMIIKKLNL